MKDGERKFPVQLLPDSVVVSNFVITREKAKRSLVENDLSRAVHDLIVAKEAENAVNDILSGASMNSTTPFEKLLSRGIGGTNQKSDGELKDTVTSETSNFYSHVSYAFFAAFQEGAILARKWEKTQRGKMKVEESPNDSWVIRLLDQKAEKQFHNFYAAFPGILYRNIESDRLYCVAYSDSQNKTWIVGAGLIGYDFSGRKNANGFHIILDDSSLADRLLVKMTENPKRVLTTMLNEIFDSHVVPDGTLNTNFPPNRDSVCSYPFSDQIRPTIVDLRTS